MDRRGLFAFAWLALAQACGPAATPTAEQWVVVTAPPFRAAVQPLCEHRKAQGMRVAVVQTTDVLSPDELRAGDARKLRARVRQLCRDFKGTSYVLLLGAVDARLGPERMVPALPGIVGRMKGEPSDNGYGCLDAGLLPGVAVGRLPARTEDEARHMIAKTLAFERDRRPGAWRRRLTILGGAPMFNPTVDALVESLAMSRLARLDPSWSGRVIYHNPQSRFCVPDDLLHQQAVKYVEQGQALTLYLGHSDPTGFAAGPARYLDRVDWARLAIPRGAGLFVTTGCNGCQLSGRDGEGYGVSAIRNPHGPVGVIGPHGISFASMGYLAAEALLGSFLAERPPARLGDGWLQIKAGIAKGPMDPITYRILDAVDGDSRIPQAVQRQEHLEMFVLLGDPALRLPVLPRDVRLQADGPASPGGVLAVRGTAPARLEGARVRLTLERPLTSAPADLQPLPPGPPAERAKIMLANHERANRFVLTQAEATVKDGGFAARLQVPAKLPWPRLTVRAYAATDAADGLGVAGIAVKK